MDFSLDADEVRVLGSLLEKEVTTPEYYPLSLIAIANDRSGRPRQPELVVGAGERLTPLRRLRFDPTRGCGRRCPG